MLSKSSVALSVLALAQNAFGIAHPGPSPTIANQHPDKVLQGFSPKPTSEGSWLKHELAKRVIASSRTCGFIGTSVLTCQVGTCMLYTSGSGPGMAGCCYGVTDGDCGWATKCVDYADYSGGKCDAACRANAFNRICTSANKPYCQSWTYGGANVKDFGCGTASDSSYTVVAESYSNSLGVTSVDLPYALQSVVATLTATSTRNLLGSSIASSARSTATRLSGGSSSSSSSSSYKSQNGTSKALGIAIAIIVVVIVLIWCGAGGLIFFFCRRSKKLTAKWDQPAAAAVPLMTTNALPPNVTVPQGTQSPGMQPVQVGQTTEYFNTAYAADATKHQSMYGVATPGSPAPPYPGAAHLAQQQPLLGGQQQHMPTELMAQPVMMGQAVPPPAHYPTPVGTPPVQQGYAISPQPSGQPNFSYPGQPQVFAAAPPPAQYVQPGQQPQQQQQQQQQHPHGVAQPREGAFELQ